MDKNGRKKKKINAVEPATFSDAEKPVSKSESLKNIEPEIENVLEQENNEEIVEPAIDDESQIKLENEPIDEIEISGEKQKEDNQIDENLNENQEIEIKEKELGISQEIVEEKLKQVLETQTPKKKKKSLIINLCLLLVNIVFMVFIVKNFMGDVGGLKFSELFANQGNQLWWIAGGIGVCIVYIFAQVLMYKVLIKDLTGKNRWGLAYDVAIVGKYYDNVTPFAVGGQPMQIVRLATNKISAGISTSIPLIKMIINNTVNMLLVVGFFIFGLPRIPLTTPLNDMLLMILEILGVIGLIITVLLVVFMFLVSSGSLFTRSFVSGILRIGYKMKIVKNYRQTFKKVINQVAEYKTSMSYLWKHKKLLLKMILLSLVECLTYASLSFFVVMALATPDALADATPFMFLFICLTKYYICAMASSFIPLPGGTGLMEISFIFMFWQAVGNNIVWALLIWRFLSYYLVIIHGFIHELGRIGYNLAKNGKRNKAVKETK